MRRSILLLVGSASLVYCNAIRATEPPVQPKRPSIKASDLLTKIDIIGELGHPLGEVMEIRGEWRSPQLTAKAYAPNFHVTHINDRRLKQSISFRNDCVEPVWQQGKESREPSSSVWHAIWYGGVKAPIPAAGEIWELRGIEVGATDLFTSSRITAELGPPTIGLPPPNAPFFTKIVYIRVRRKVVLKASPRPPERDAPNPAQ